MQQKEWFFAEPIIAWLREVNWLGNAGNLSEIMQVLDVSSDTERAGDLNANRECLTVFNPERCSQNADKEAGITCENKSAPAVLE